VLAFITETASPCEARDKFKMEGNLQVPRSEDVTTVKGALEILLSKLNLTSLLTPWSRVLLEKLTGPKLVKKFPAFYGTRRFITALTSARHLSLS
jgi:hypothetical protein